MSPRAPASARRRGGILFEVMLSIALFAGAGAFALGATRGVFTRLDRIEREQRALDYARSKLAELEAGLVTLAELQEGAIDRIGSIEELGLEDVTSPTATAPTWILDVSTERTEYRGLTLVMITVREEPAALAADESGLASATIRQLVRLRGEDAEEYEMDEMLRDLPGVAP